MFEDLLESLRLEESIAKKLHVLHESMTWEQIVLALYQLLDDIDTAEDIAKDNDKAFRDIVRKTQAEKNKYLHSPDGYKVEPVVDVAAPDPNKPSKPPQSDLDKTFRGDDDSSLMKYNVTEAVAVLTSPEVQMQDYHKDVVNTKLVKSDYPGERDDFKFWLLTNGDVIPVKHSHMETSDDAGIGHKELMDAGSFIGRIHGQELNLTSSRNHKFTAKQISRLKGIQIEYKITNLLVVAEDVFHTDIKSPKELGYYLEYGKEEWESINKDECVCHIYDMEDKELIEFYQNVMIDQGPEHYGSGSAGPKQYPRDRAEVERELKKRNLMNEEVKKPLTPSQQKALDKFEPGKEYSAYGLQVGLGTLNALMDKGYLTRKSGLGSMAFPRTSIQFKLKENLTGHAQKELKLAGLFDKDSDYDGMLGEAVMELMKVFSKQGHSGASAMMVREVFSKLVNYEPLTEITDNPDEWQAVSEYYGGPAKDLVEMEYQCLRNPALFSSDGGSTYWDVNDRYLSEEQGYDGSMAMWDKRPMYTSKHREKE